MEKMHHEFTPQIEPSPENQGIEIDPVAQEAEAILEQAIDSTAELFQEINTVEDSANPAELQQTKKIKKDASSALTKLYNKFRKLSLPMTILLGGYVAHAQYNKKEDTYYNDGKHLDRGHLSAKMAIVDTYLSSDVVDTYNKCVDFVQARKDGKMSPEEIDFKEKIAQRFLPFGYGIPVVADLWRLHKINTGDAEYTKEALANNTTNWQNRIGNDVMSMMGDDTETGDRVRADMFRKYLGLEQYFGSVKPADFKPSQAKEDSAKYFQFDPQEILKSIFTIKNPLKRKSFDYLADYIKKHNKFPLNSYTRQLGKYKAYVGFDKEKNEDYVSYYDLWNMEPPQLKKLGLDVDQFNFPYEIYGRIYKSDFDKYLAK